MKRPRTGLVCERGTGHSCPPGLRGLQLNAGARGAGNPLRADPSRTTSLRKRFLREMRQRWKRVVGEVRDLVVKEDAFGLKADANASKPFTAMQRWRFLTDDAKVEAFHTWLDDSIKRNILTTSSGTSAWTAKYVGSAYRQGIVRAYTDTRKYPDLTKPAGFIEGTRQQFLRSAFGAPETASKLKLLQTRSYESLRGVTASMSSRMGVSLAQGLADGRGAVALGQRLASAADLPLSRAMTIARTEVMHAHSEGQLDSFEMLGVEEVGVMAEWSTAGDERVCPVCQPLEGTVMTIKEARGLIPRHPNCRCTWIPANVTEKEAGQKRTKKSITKAIESSLKRETGEKTTRGARSESRWLGADRSFAGKRSQDLIL